MCSRRFEEQRQEMLLLQSVLRPCCAEAFAQGHRPASLALLSGGDLL